MPPPQTQKALCIMWSRNRQWPMQAVIAYLMSYSGANPWLHLSGLLGRNLILPVEKIVFAGLGWCQTETDCQFVIMFTRTPITCFVCLSFQKHFLSSREEGGQMTNSVYTLYIYTELYERSKLFLLLFLYIHLCSFLVSTFSFLVSCFFLLPPPTPLLTFGQQQPTTQMTGW